MISHINDDFRELFAKLPAHIQGLARKNYKLWKRDPFHHSLQFKQVHPTVPIWSVRVARGWRAVGWRENDVIIWYWIGSHGDYDKLLAKL